MNEVTYFQCMNCGKIHKINIEYNIDSNEIYDLLYCDMCQKETKQLWIGNDQYDKYLYYDVTIDERYFLY